MLRKKATANDVRDFRDWIIQAIKGGATTYDAQHSTGCLVCQYLKSKGNKVVQFNGETRLHIYKHVDDPPVTVELPPVIAKIAYGMRGTIGDYSGYTFQGALERANELLAKMR